MAKKRRRWLLIVPAGLLGVCVLLVLASAISNGFLRERSTIVERLSEADKARLAEVFHLRREVGDAVWPGWDEAQIPLVIYNEEYAFLVGYPGDPGAGWQKVPQGTVHGGSWEVVAGDSFQGEVYYRVALPADGTTPQAFVVRVGDAWAASMQTRELAEMYLVEQLQQDLPGVLAAIFPYQVAINLFLGGTDKYVSMILHESFHAYQGQVAAERLAATERSAGRLAAAYPWDDPEAVALWQAELELLREAVEAETREEQAALVEAFLAQRAERRERMDLSAALIKHEQEREWEEGLAKYVELEVWRQGDVSAEYEPVAATALLADFDDYDTFVTAWEREVDQIARMAEDEGDGRFYYSGMAQATLLDALRPGWKAAAMQEGVTLEGLLAGEEAAQGAAQEAAQEAAQGAEEGPEAEATREGTESAGITGVGQQVVEVYFGNSRLNPEADCGAVFPVTRTVAGDAVAAFAALDALFSGPTGAEQADGYHSWFSKETANALLSLKITEGGTAYVNLADIRRIIPNASTSCGSREFRAEVETTLKAAAPGVRRVLYAIKGEPRAFYEWMQMGCVPENDNCDPAPFER